MCIRDRAVAARSTVGQMLPDVVFGCLRQVRPDRVPAEGTSCLWNIRLAGGQGEPGVSAEQMLRARRFNIMGFNTGGTGARPLPVSYTHLRAHETPEHLVC